MPGIPLIGSFETAFHSRMSPEAYLYSIPLEISRKYNIRRYGFHGASHEYMTGWVSDTMKRRDLRIISCHLGGSGSLAAVRDGVCIDTTMGMSLQCGILNNNRIGEIDPYVIFYLNEKCGMKLPDIKKMLQTESGLYGLSGGISNDLRDIEVAAEQGNQDAETALKSYAYIVKKYIGSYAAALGGVDAIVFGGGIGQNSSTIRRLALDGLEFMGIVPDESKNLAAQAGEDISADGSHTRIYVVETNEELIVARKAIKLLR
jgi:acetate kinase